MLCTERFSKCFNGGWLLFEFRWGKISCGIRKAHLFPKATKSKFPHLKISHFSQKMGDDDAEPPRQHGDPHNRRHFPVGSLIEVHDDVEEGVYFSATVVSSPTSRRRSSSRNSEKLRVKYHNLLALEDGPDPLTESVDVSYVRPAPPSQVAAAERFEPNDVVDAFYKDGWWKGVVSRVVEGGERFEVTFENPPDVLEFGPSALRPHWDWVDGTWIGPQKQSEVAFEVGEKVEASLESDDDFIGAWIPATIVEISGNGAYFVELKDKNGGCVKAEVDSTHLRPSPPIFQQRVFGTLERVDAFFNFGWWRGFITKTIKKNRYGVFLEHMKLNKVFNRSELRARMVWKDGKWFVGSALTSISETTSPSTKRRKGGGDNQTSRKRRKFAQEKIEKKKIEHANQETEYLAIEKNVSVQVSEPQSLVSSVLLDEGRNEHANQETEDMAIEKFVVQDENPIMGVENVSVQEDEEQIKDIRSPPLIDGSSLVPQSWASSAVIDEGDVLPDSGWPFAKRNVAWKAIESMEVFRRIPQRPHFLPLYDFKETAREGMAIGYMVTFSNVVERSSILNIKDPKCDMEDIIEALPNLEANGFDVGMVRNRVMKLLGAKDKEEKLVHELRDIKDQIEEHRYAKSRIEKEIMVVRNHLRRLHEQLEILQIAKAKELQQIAHLKAGLDQNQQQINILRSGFEAAAASILSSR